MSDGYPASLAVISRKPGGWLLGLSAALLVLLSLGGESWREALRYERDAVMTAGEYWRLLTGHLVHGSTLHLLLNGAGLALVAGLFPGAYGPLQWAWIFAASLLAIDAGFVWLEPQLQWYVGLSGVLHGTLAAGALMWWRRESRPLAFALTVIFIGKLAWEQYRGALPLSGDIPVIVDAHLYGAVGGALAGAILWLREWHWPSGRRPL